MICFFVSVRIIGEPGRYFCSGSSTLAVVVNSKRKKKLVVAPPASEEQHEDEQLYEVVEEVRARREINGTVFLGVFFAIDWFVDRTRTIFTTATRTRTNE